jgi:hypothetical protein
MGRLKPETEKISESSVNLHCSLEATRPWGPTCILYNLQRTKGTALKLLKLDHVFSEECSKVGRGKAHANKALR